MDKTIDSETFDLDDTATFSNERPERLRMTRQPVTIDYVELSSDSEDQTTPFFPQQRKGGKKLAKSQPVVSTLAKKRCVRKPQLHNTTDIIDGHVQEVVGSRPFNVNLVNAQHQSINELPSTIEPLVDHPSNTSSLNTNTLSLLRPKTNRNAGLSKTSSYKSGLGARTQSGSTKNADISISLSEPVVISDLYAPISSPIGGIEADDNTEDLIVVSSTLGLNSDRTSTPVEDMSLSIPTVEWYNTTQPLSAMYLSPVPFVDGDPDCIITFVNRPLSRIKTEKNPSETASSSPNQTTILADACNNSYKQVLVPVPVSIPLLLTLPVKVGKCMWINGHTVVVQAGCPQPTKPQQDTRAESLLNLQNLPPILEMHPEQTSSVRFLCKHEDIALNKASPTTRLINCKHINPLFYHIESNIPQPEEPLYVVKLSQDSIVSAQESWPIFLQSFLQLYVPVSNTQSSWYTTPAVETTHEQAMKLFQRQKDFEASVATVTATETETETSNFFKSPHHDFPPPLELLTTDAPPPADTSFSVGEEERYDEDIDSIVVLESNAVKPLRDWPHPRFSCQVYPFIDVQTATVEEQQQMAMKYCCNCFCFICDGRVGECASWYHHCIVTNNAVYQNLKKCFAKTKSDIANELTSKGSTVMPNESQLNTMAFKLWPRWDQPVNRITKNVAGNQSSLKAWVKKR